MIILMGVAGSGKSLQGRILADEYGYEWISTGEILRKIITGKRREELLAGKLFSDEEMINIIDNVFTDMGPEKEFVLDGFPRTVIQADWLLDQVKKKRVKLTAVCHLSASEDIVRQRLEERARQDDTDAAIAKRFEEYKNVTVPIIEHLQKVGIPVYDINAAQDPRLVHAEIMKNVEGNNG